MPASSFRLSVGPYKWFPMALLAALLGVMTFATPSLALEAQKKDSTFWKGMGSDWSTASHLGFGVIDRSSTGFKKGTGSVAFFDIAKEVSPNLNFGLRTLAEGAKLEESAFYRLGVGPMISWQPNDDWNLQLALTRFNETGMDLENEPQYRSKGVGTQACWERIFEFGSDAELAFGGFLSIHNGDLTTTAATIGNTQRYQSQRNAGIGHGVEAALRVRL